MLFEYGSKHTQTHTDTQGVKTLTVSKNTNRSSHSIDTVIHTTNFTSVTFNSSSTNSTPTLTELWPMTEDADQSQSSSSEQLYSCLCSHVTSVENKRTSVSVDTRSI